MSSRYVAEVNLPDTNKTFAISWTEEDTTTDVTSYGFGFANKVHKMPVMVSMVFVICVCVIFCSKASFCNASVYCILQRKKKNAKN